LSPSKIQTEGDNKMSIVSKLAAGFAVLGLAAGIAALPASASPRGNGDCAMQQNAQGYGNQQYGKRWNNERGPRMDGMRGHMMGQRGQDMERGHGWGKGRQFAQQGQGMMRPGAGQGQGMGQGMGQGQGQGQGQFMMERFGQIDTDGDGKITAAELNAQRESIFYAMDADDSGDLTMEEFMAVRMGPGAGNEGGMGRMEEQRQAAKQAMFAPMDTDGNGKLSMEEWNAGGKTEMSQMDTNGDGVITGDEFGKNH
jgi:hypothetical protein